MKYDVFISYSRVDTKIVNEFVDRFQKEGYLVWIDKDGIESGDAFKSTIVSAIENSRLFVFFSSKNSNESEWTAKEIGIANNRKKTIIPIKLDDSNFNRGVEFDLINLDYIDYTAKHNRETGMDKLLRTLHNKLGTKSQVDSTDDEQKAKERRSSGNIVLGFLASHKKACVVAIVLCAVSCLIIPPFILNKSLYSTLGNEQYDKSSIALGDTPSSSESSSIESQNTVPVDLGLPSGTLWADRNLGAKSSTDYGNLYAWGEVNPKKDYSQGTYSKITCNLITATRYDAAFVNLSREWCMPTKAQFEELVNNCQWQWTSNKGINGYNVIGKNGNSIFLPATGWSCSSKPEHKNKFGYYWTGNKVNDVFAVGVLFPRDNKIGNAYLYYGRAIRAVKVNDKNIRK